MKIDLSKYPSTWSDFVGQERAKRQLQIASASARQRNVRLPHILLASGVPGIGKTALALLIARERGTNMRLVTGKVDRLAALMVMSSMSDDDILFIDEFHQLVTGGKAKAEWLLHYLQDGFMVGPKGVEKVPNLTVVAATTDAGRLPETILSRFPLRPPLVPYTTEEATTIARRAAEPIMADLAPPSESNLRQIAEASGHNPRLILHLISHLRDLATVEAIERTSEGYNLDEVFDWASLTPDGLTELAVRYLVVLHEEFEGQSGESNLRAVLREPGGLEATERMLAERGLIAFTSRGRTLTAAGIARARREIDPVFAEVA